MTTLKEALSGTESARVERRTTRTPRPSRRVLRPTSELPPDELAAIQWRAYGREAALAALAACVAGTVCLLVCYLAGEGLVWESQRASVQQLRPETARASRSLFDFTGAFAAAAACFYALSLTVFGGTLFNFRHMRQTPVALILVSAGLSVAGMALLIWGR